MTLDQVLSLDNRGLNLAVAQRLGWEWVTCPKPIAAFGAGLKGFRTLVSPDWRTWSTAQYLAPASLDLPISWPDIDNLPDFAGDWTAAMEIQHWARKTTVGQRGVFLHNLLRAAEARRAVSGEVLSTPQFIIVSEPIDYARAICLVGEVPT